ncbi:low molecular weight protein-tyrosine-phosphatase [Bacillaceae bacterium]
MIRVLFVCLGNICRSPMAEAVFRKLVEDEGLAGSFAIDSAGIGHWHIGKPPHEGTRRILKEHGIDCRGMKARQITADDLRSFDYIVAMDAENCADLRSLSGTGSESERRPQIFRLLDFAPEKGVRDVPDPYYTGNFAEVYELVEAGCRGLLKHIRDKEKL